MGNTANTPLKIGSTLQAQKVARCLPVSWFRAKMIKLRILFVLEMFEF
jgi:hypothetical protein